ncbi:aspartate carbamoyltransferase 2 [Quercus suber]|uniref:Aspartate carbamoyltransferase 2 n=1 Tax=Quercus suber TaxID=58331 RepID=A0AAW0MAF7_QUESU
MAVSSSLFTSSLQGSMVAPKTLNREYMCSPSNLSCRQFGYIKSMYLTHSRIVPSGKLLKRKQTDGVSPKDRIQCRAVQVENAPSFSVGKKFQLDDVIEAQQFDRDILGAIFEVAHEMEKIEKNSPGSQILKGYLMATLFYEPSTRTRLSFESAMKRLGGEVLTTENAREFSSAAKGETLEDTIRTIEGYSDIIVMRHFESGAAKRAAVTAGIPIINAGDGPGQHPKKQ